MASVRYSVQYSGRILYGTFVVFFVYNIVLNLGFVVVEDAKADIMINGLKYTASSLPGKRRKTQSSTQNDAEKKAKRQKYEKEIRERAFQPSWKVDRDWLQYGEASNKMRCQTCIDFYNNDERRSMVRPESMKWLDEFIYQAKKAYIYQTKGHKISTGRRGRQASRC
ncbi:uncharacterized protein LOC128231490 [Mya arenaria]|uniref:uncharacterized protein LOC128231490 n=1 Tax=Mya arenaria TaxID=6604 RepID=UPI0022E43124|nr:uncharacterized protein LOC128231490 [Mya arenaria]